MADRPSIECAKNGPLLVKSLKTLTGIADGKQFDTKEVTALCRCGSSKNKPYCDGTHRAIGFEDDKSSERTADQRESFVGKGITIHDNRGICAHAGFCTDRLSSVFRMKQEPWIDADGASVEEVIEVIKACPSGALSYTKDGVDFERPEADPQVLVAPNGPFAVKGQIELQGVEWGAGAAKDCYDLCRCGASKNKPFCDGSHWNTKFDEHANG